MIIDTSSILFGISFRKDAFEIAKRRFHGCTFLIPRGIVRELDSISRNRGRKGAGARAALSLIRVKNLKVNSNNGSVDSWIASTAARHNNIVVITNDTVLFKKVKPVNRNVFKLSKSGTLKQ